MLNPVPSADPSSRLDVAVLLRGLDIAPGPDLDVYGSAVSAGFPSPADDYKEGRINLHRLLELESPSVYVVQAEGWSMRDEGIFDGDAMVVDRAARPKSGDIVVAAVDGELTVKRYLWTGRRPQLLSANPDYPPIELEEGQELTVWGVVTVSLRCHRKLPGLRRAAA